MITPAKTVRGENYFREIFSYSERLSGFLFENCDFARADLVSAKIYGTTFVNCALEHMDASGAEFEDCTFQDCSFRHTNFAKARFLGCQIRQSAGQSNPTAEDYSEFTSRFSKASFTQAQFGPSETQPTVLDGLFVSATGFKYGLFQGVRITNCLFYGTSFESCLLRDVEIDCLDLRRSACNYLEIKTSQVGQFIAPASKLLEIIGINAILQKSKFLVTFGHDQSHRIETVDDVGLLKIFKDGTKQSIEYGRYAPAVNSFVTLHFLSDHPDWSPAPEHGRQLQVIRHLLGKVGLDETVTALLRAIFEQKMETGRPAKLDDVANLLTILRHHRLQNEAISGIIEAIAGHALATDRGADDLTKAQFNLGLERYFRSVSTGKFQVAFWNKSVDLDDIAASVLFSRFVRDILDLSGADASRAYALQQGSILEQVRDLSASNIGKIACLMFLLNCDFSFSDRHGYHFEYTSPHTTVEKVVSFVVDELGPALLEEWRQDRAALEEELLRALPTDQEMARLQEYTGQYVVSARAMPQPYDGSARVRQIASL